MVHLTMTTAIVQALEKLQSVDTIPEHTDDQSSSDHSEAKRAEHENAREEALPGTASRKVNEKDATTTEPSLKSPRVGNPISHSQIIDLSRQLKAQHITPNDLETLLRGIAVYIAPPPPKPEPVPSSTPSDPSQIILIDPLVLRIQSPHGPSPSRTRSAHLSTHDPTSASTRDIRTTLPHVVVRTRFSLDYL